MRIRKLVSRAKKGGQAVHAKTRARVIVAIIGGVIGVTGAVAVSMFAAPSAPAPASPGAATASKPSTASNLSPQRAAENRKAQAELASPSAGYAEGTTGTTLKASPITLTGCLEQRGDEFRLKDASGTDAPKSRSWKTGFLTKHTPAIDVVDATHKLKLADHVGQRVSVTGTLVDREMQARTLKGVGSCN